MSWFEWWLGCQGKWLSGVCRTGHSVYCVMNTLLCSGQPLLGIGMRYKYLYLHFFGAYLGSLTHAPLFPDVLITDFLIVFLASPWWSRLLSVTCKLMSYHMSHLFPSKQSGKPAAALRILPAGHNSQVLFSTVLQAGTVVLQHVWVNIHNRISQCCFLWFFLFFFWEEKDHKIIDRVRVDSVCVVIYKYMYN